MPPVRPIFSPADICDTLFYILRTITIQQPDLINTTLNNIHRNLYNLDRTIFQRLFLTKDALSYTLLMHACEKEDTEPIKNYIHFIGSHPELFNYETVQDLLFEKVPQGYSVLMRIACSSDFEVLQLILSYIDREISFSNVSFDPFKHAFFEDKERLGHTLLMETAKQYPRSLKILLDFIASHPSLFDAYWVQLLFLDTDLNGSTLLMNASHFQPVSLRYIFAFIDNNIHWFKIPEPFFLKKICLVKDSTGYTPLMYATRGEQAERINYHMDFMAFHRDIFNSETVQYLVLDKNQQGHSVLMRTTCGSPEALRCILSFINKDIRLFNASYDTFCKDTFVEHKDPLGYTLLMQAVGAQPESVKWLFDFISSHPQLFSKPWFPRLFTDKDLSHCTILMRAIYLPESLRYILGFIEQNIHLFTIPDHSFLKKILLEVDPWRTTILMFAAEHQPLSVIPLLEFFTKNIQIIGIDIIRYLFLNKIRDHASTLIISLMGGTPTLSRYQKTVLMISEREGTPAVPPLLEFIDHHIFQFGAEALLELLKQKSNERNALIEASLTYGKPLKKVLKFIVASKKSLGNEAEQELAEFILAQFSILPLSGRLPAYFETGSAVEYVSLVNEILSNYSPIILKYFERFDRLDNLAFITDRLFSIYLDRLNDRIRKGIHYTTPFVLFHSRHSAQDKKLAANELRTLVNRLYTLCIPDTRRDSGAMQYIGDFERLFQMGKSRYSLLRRDSAINSGDLGRIYRAYCRIFNDLAEKKAFLLSRGTLASSQENNSQNSLAHIPHPSLM